MSSEKARYLAGVDSSAPPPAYAASSPASNYGGQYGGDYNTQYAQQSNVQMVQTQPGVMMLKRNIAAGKQYTNLFIGSIVVTLLCCLPIGIFAIKRARQAKTAAEMGRVVEAEDHASASKDLIIASVVCGIVLMVIIVGLRVYQQTRRYCHDC